jgi:adenosylhomocysteine nucleosidase
MKGFLVVCAMGMEAEAIPAGYRVVKTGPGFRAARQAVEAAIAEERPEWVISAGTCGALDPGLRLGEVRVVTKVDSPLGVFDAPGSGATVLRSQDRVAVTAVEKRGLFEAGSQIVDMEAAAVVEVCQKHRLRYGIVKAVSDLAEEDLPLDFNLYRDEAGNFQKSRIAIAGMMKIADLMRLQKQAKLAAQQLGETFDVSIADITR